MMVIMSRVPTSLSPTRENHNKRTKFLEALLAGDDAHAQKKGLAPTDTSFLHQRPHPPVYRVTHSVLLLIFTF